MVICEWCRELQDDEYPSDQCPNCGHDMAIAVKCDVCGEWMPEDGSFNMCDECEEEWLTVENAYAAAEENEDYTEVKINAFALELLGADGIRDAIAEAIKNVKDDRATRHKAWKYASFGEPMGFVDAVLAGKNGEKV